jgi:hypothetical protein
LGDWDDKVKVRHLLFSFFAQEILSPADTGTMAEESTPATQDPTPSTSDVPEGAVTPVEPDAIQPFIDKAHDTIQGEVDIDELGRFLRAHIKTFREEWESLSDGAKDTYMHMMTAQLLQRKAAAIQIGLGHAFKLPKPSAQSDLLKSLQDTQVKSHKRYPAIDIPPRLRRLTF